MGSRWEISSRGFTLWKISHQRWEKMLNVTEEIEGYVKENGGKLAFPTNLAVNNVGAHWTPSTKSKDVFKRGDVVKLDVGVHIDGYIGDNALTIEVETNEY